MAKYTKIRGGSLPVVYKPKSRMSFPKAFNSVYRAYKSPLGQSAASFAANKFGFKKSTIDKVFSTVDGATAFVGKSLRGSSIGNVPTTYGAFGSVTTTKYVEGKNYLPKRIKEIGKNIDISNSSTNLEATTSQQNALSFAALPAAKLIQIANNYAKLYTSTRTAVNSGRYYVDYVSSETKITNSSNVGVTLDIYEIIPRYNFDDVSSQLSSPLTAWLQGYVDSSPVGITGTSQVPLNITTYGAQPLDSDVFTSYFVIKKIFNVELPASTTHVHTSRYNICKMFDSSNILNSQATGSMKNFTKWTMVVAKGNPVHASADSDSVGTSPVFLDLTTSIRMQTYGAPGNDTITGITSGFAVPATPQVYGPPTTEQTVVGD